MHRILNLLQLRRSEVARLVHAALVFFLVNVNDGIVKSVAAAVFNTRVGVDQLPLMYSWIAVLFAVSMAGMSWLTGRVARQRLLFGMLGALLVVLAFNAGMLLLEHRQAAELDGTGFYPFLFVSSELVRSMTGFQIWIVAGGICYTSRAKALFPLLAASATLGDIGGGFAMRFLGPVLVSYQLYGLAVLNLAAIVLLLRPLVRRYFVSAPAGTSREAAGLGENLRYFVRSRYLLTLFLLSIALFGLYTAIHYTFNVVAQAQYPAEAGITSFFGLFYGVTGVATLVATVFLLRVVLRWVGAGNVYLGASAVHLAMAVGLWGIFRGLLPLPPVVAVFALNLLNFLLLDSIIAPTYQVLVKLVPQRYSDGTRMLMEGGFMLLGGLLGAGLTLLHARDLLSLAGLFLALAGLAAIMILAGWYLKGCYTAVLIRAVREQDIDVDDAQAMASLRKLIAGSADFARSLLLHRNDGVRQLGIEILRQHSGPSAVRVCLPLTTHENPRIRSAALDALGAGLSGQEILDHLLPRLDDDDPEVRMSAARALARLLGERATQPVVGLGPEQAQPVIEAVLPRLLREGEPAGLQAQCLVILDRLRHADSAPTRHAILQSLLAREQAEAVIAGVEAVERLREEVLYPQVLAHLGNAHPAVREAAARSLGELGWGGATGRLLQLLGDPDPDVVEAAVHALGRTRQPGERQALVQALPLRPAKEWKGLVAALIALDDADLVPRLMASARERLIEANRYLVAVGVLQGHHGGPVIGLLVDQLRLECQRVQEGVVRLLGDLGDVTVVSDLVERLGEDDAEARENAVELLENIGDRDLLARLLPLLEADEEARRDAALRYSGWEAADLDTALEFLLRAPDPWTQLAAVWAAAALGRPHLLERLPAAQVPQVQESLAQIHTRGGTAVDAEEQPLTTMEKIAFLKQSSFFAALPLEELYPIALSMQEENVAPGKAVIVEATQGDKMYIVVRGRLEVRKSGGPDQPAGQVVAVLAANQVFGEMALLDDEPRSASVVAVEHVHLLSLQRSDLERILRRYSSIAFSMMRILSRRLRESMAA